ncbi:hypothetical protein ACOMHN_041450 [Nucella lapillus]
MRSISGTSGASSWELMEDCSPQSPDSLPPGRGNSAVGLSAPLGTARHCNGTRCLKYWTVSSVCPQTLMLERRSKKKGLPKKARLQKAFAKKVDFRDKPREELPYLKVPLHAVETWAPVASGCLRDFGVCQHYNEEEGARLDMMNEGGRDGNGAGNDGETNSGGTGSVDGKRQTRGRAARGT